MADLHQPMTQFEDIMNGLKLSTDFLAPPHSIEKVENYEHDYAVTINHPAPRLAAGLDEVEAPDTDQTLDLVLDLNNFQELDRIRFGVLTGGEDVSVHEDPEDYYLSEDESVEELPSTDDST